MEYGGVGNARACAIPPGLIGSERRWNLGVNPARLPARARIGAGTLGETLQVGSAI